MKNAVPKRRGAPKRGEPSARERLVDTVTELFYREGARAVGIDTVAERAGVSKSSLYRTFDSKDALITAYVEEQNRKYWHWWDEVVDAHSSQPRVQIEALFKALAAQISNPQFRGCPFINLATEIPDRRHPGTAIACANKQEVCRRLCGLSRALGVRDPRQLGERLALLVDGAYGRAMTLGTHGLERELLAMVDLLVSAAIKGKPDAATAEP